MKRPQRKLVRVSQGKVFDVALDPLEDNPTYGQWMGTTLSTENKQMMWIPPGFAHGFYVTSKQAELHYKCINYYYPKSEVYIRWDDSPLTLIWPLVGGEAPQVSANDASGLTFYAVPKTTPQGASTSCHG